MLVWVAVILWLVIVAWSLALMRASSASERRDEPSPARRPQPTRISQRLLMALQPAILAGCLTTAALLSDASQWHPASLVGLIGLLAVGGDLLTLDAKRFRISLASLGLVLAMAVLGPAPAVAFGLASVIADAVRTRPRGAYLLNNLATFATFPLLGGIALYELHDVDSVERGGFALAVFVVFMLANILNFTMIAGYAVLLRGGSLRQLFANVYLPVLPWELVTASITAMAVYGFEVYGAGIIGIFAVALGVCLLLLRALLEGHAQSEEAQRRTDQLDVRHEGMLGLLLETLALRDPTAARHAAAVAHYAHELARVAGLDERERAVVHTAGLLHDIGKQGLPDHLLLGRAELHSDERRLIERHPADGARLLLRVEGLGEVATAVLAHHERVDGRGYPDGLAGDDIPMTARILAIAEVYDALTASDSYRVPVTPAQAEEELRRVAGTQLDGRLVFLFLTQVLRAGADHEGPIADLEAELQAQRRMRGVLDAPMVLGPPS